MLYVEGEIETRSYKDASGNTRYVTEVVVPRYTGVIRMVSAKEAAASPTPSSNNVNDASGDFNNQF